MADDIPISGLPPAPPLDGTENTPIVKGGTNYRAAVQAIANLVPGLAIQIQNLNPRATLDGSESIVLIKDGVAYRTTVQEVLDLVPETQSLPAGGTTGQVLTKLSGANYHVGWTTPVVQSAPTPPAAATGTLAATEASDTAQITGPLSSFTGTLAATGASDTAAIAGTVTTVSGIAWNPNDKDAGILLSNGNLTATRATGSSHVMARATQSRLTGDYYWEATIGSVADLAVGLANASQILSGDYLGNTANSIAYFESGYIQYGTYGSGPPALNAQVAGYTTGNVIGVRWTATNGTGTVRFYKGGILVYTSPTITLGAAFPILDLKDGGDTLTGNFGASSLMLPTGVTSWDGNTTQGGGGGGGGEDPSALVDESGANLVDENGATLTS